MAANVRCQGMRHLQELRGNDLGQMVLGVGECGGAAIERHDLAVRADQGHRYGIDLAVELARRQRVAAAVGPAQGRQQSWLQTVPITAPCKAQGLDPLVPVLRRQGPQVRPPKR